MYRQGWEGGLEVEGSYMVQAISEEQLKAAVEPMEQVEDGIEEISEEDLEGVAGGGKILNAFRNRS